MAFLLGCNENCRPKSELAPSTSSCIQLSMWYAKSKLELMKIVSDRSTRLSEPAGRSIASVQIKRIVT